MPFINEKLSEKQRQEFADRGIKRPWDSVVPRPLYRTYCPEGNMCLWNLGIFDRDYFDHHIFLFEWNGYQHTIVMEGKFAEDHLFLWSPSEFEKNTLSDKPYAEDLRAALSVYGADGCPQTDYTTKVVLEKQNQAR